MHEPQRSITGIRESFRVAAPSLVSMRSPSTAAESTSQVPVWFERKFEFSFPIELCPNLLARLRGTAARLEETFRGRTHEVLIRKPGEKWSAQEHAGHLLDLEPLWLARVSDYVAARTELTVADLTNRKTDEAK